ncbi:hypothetical protein GOP47_0010106 [Adiantum capillus-veneris]|uniref:Zer-1-like leucine-rich repeats region domain-containing protein n=1 Tax=Adiantum capillus-veneris TaxID=13818 RepID=A0A9D4UU43_ADICA|nr:hypothetical protein GOP47_0010106 [Adiantum capillus-veneris]
MGMGMNKLRTLDIRCFSLEILPDVFGADLRPILEVISLKGCRNLRNLPESVCNLKALNELDLSGCSRLEQLPRKFEGLSCNLRTLRLVDCEVMKELPRSICQFKSLGALDLEGCYRLMEEYDPARLYREYNDDYQLQSMLQSYMGKLLLNACARDKLLTHDVEHIKRRRQYFVGVCPTSLEGHPQNVPFQF